jgi:signal peptidase II
MPTSRRRTLLFAVALVTLVLDLASKQWAVGTLANAVHPMVVTQAGSAGAKTIADAFTAHGLTVDEVTTAARQGWIVQATPAGDVDLQRVLAESDVGTDLIALAGTGLPPPRRLWVRQSDVGKTLGDVIGKAWRVDPSAVPAVLQHTWRGQRRVDDATATLEPGRAYVLRERTVPVVAGFWTYVYAENFGAAWSFLANAPAMLRWSLFVLVSLVASCAMAWVLWTGRMGSTWSSFALAAILGGAVGNLVDRLRYHAVVDFIYNFVEIGDKVHGWPVYNVADIGITAGVIALAGEMLFARKPEAPKNTTDQPAAPPAA